MQLQGPSANQVPPLPPVPPVDRWVFEQPQPLAIAIAAVGLLVGIAMLRGGSRKAGSLALLVGLAAGAGVFLAGTLIETPRETISRLAATLATAAADGDRPAVAALLEPDARVAPGQSRLAGLFALEGRERIADEVTRLARFGLGRIQVLETRAALDGTRVGRCQIRVRALNNEGGWINHSWWLIDWVERDGTWRASKITPLWFQGS
ncbi:MAG: nuclear transport factor 2 family protein [Planctomycetota bacterium]